MPVLISMLRAVNVGGHSKIKMDALRALYASLKFDNPQTYLQSGNVIFKTSERKLDVVAKRIQSGTEKKFACHTDIILRTTAELRSVVARNPFAKRSDIEPSKLLVAFLASDPGDAARKTLQEQKFAPEELHVSGRELYIYFPDGMGKSKLPWPRIYKTLNTPGTGRNWNSVTKMLEMAENLESSE
ncbi:MAG TPA: DUF1697 domain-containing protein [Candidatus Udaeobacter sp.]|nr:DUF1697 domain-containing protein [Candidatus Udaeobacter sp.]